MRYDDLVWANPKFDFVRTTRCEFAATTLAVIAATAAVAGAGVSAYGQYSQGQAAKSAAEFNAQVAKNNASSAEMSAAADAQQLLSRNKRLQGSQIAGMAAAGIDPNSGSASDVQYDSRVQGELDALTTQYKGHIQGMNDQAQASLDRFQGNAAQTAGYIGAGGSILSGAASGAMNYSTIRNNPSFRGFDDNYYD